MINRTLSPLLTFSFALTFGFLCIYIFNTVIAANELWTKMFWFAVANTMVNFHLFANTLVVLWTCESTTNVESEVLKHLFKLVIETDEIKRINKVNCTP